MELRINQRKIAVGCGEEPLALQPILVLGQGLPQNLAAVFAALLLFQGSEQTGDAAGCQMGQRFTGRQQDGLRNGPAAALRHGVKYPKGVDLVAEKLRADGLLCPCREYVQNAAAQRKLTGTLYLIVPGVSGRDQSGADFLHIVKSIIPQDNGGLIQHLGRHGAQHHAVGRRAQHPTFFGADGLQRA